MKRLVLLLLITSLALAQSIGNGICEPEERGLGYADCSFGSVCVDDGQCTSVENAAGCSDCSETPVAKCINDGLCSDSERALGDCADCQPKPIDGNILLLAGGIGVLGFLVIGGVILIIVAAFAVSHFGNRRIRM
ncbi:hypothetical protein ACFLQ2_04480 [archaeon]